MEITNYLTSVGMSMSQVFTKQAVGIAITNKILDAQEQQVVMLGDLMPPPEFGRMIDVRA